MLAQAVNEGLPQQLEALRDAVLVDCALRLYVNNETLTPATVLGDLDEATFIGYTTEPTPDWGAVSLNGNKAETAHPPIIWTDGSGASGETVYGWMLVHPGSGKLIIAKPFDTPIAMTTINKTVIVAPTFTLGDDPAN